MGGGFIAALVHFAPQPLSSYSEEQSTLFCGLLMGAVALLAFLMVSTVRYSSFKTVGAGRRGPRYIILGIAAVGMLVWLFSRYVLIAFVSLYILHGLFMRLLGVLRYKAAKTPAA
jgi:CDP-diacylglycerol--serine O-phosphatidyltransferase